MAGQTDYLERFLVEVWAELGDFTRPRCGYPGLAVLATTGAAGPEVRHVVLRKADRAAAQLIVHTDSATAKVAEIRANPAVSLLVWNGDSDMQVRVRGRAEILGAYAAEQIWADLPFAARGNYGVSPAPGTPIPAAHAYDRLSDRTRLAVISINLTEIDALRLSQPHHMRARFRRDGGWDGNWIAP